MEQAAEFDHFAHHVAEGIELVKDGETKATLLIGTKKWPFPIPIVRKNGGWLFDTQAGREEILTRRIGHNELLAINVCHAYVEAQREYYRMPEPDGDQIPKYAQHLISRPGKRDGLYWPTAAGEKESPLGPLVAKAKEQGYMLPKKPGEHGPRPFHGYYFKILKGQGKSAPGGKVQLRHQRQYGGRLCTGGVPCQVGGFRRDDLHREPAWQGVPEEPGAEVSRTRPQNEGVRSRHELEDRRAVSSHAFTPGR